MRGEEAPCSFYVGGHRLHVTTVLQRWQDATHQYYEVMVDDGRRFVLSLEPRQRSWELAAVFAPEMRRPKPKPAVLAAPRRFFLGFRKTPAAKVP